MAVIPIRIDWTGSVEELRRLGERARTTRTCIPAGLTDVQVIEHLAADSLRRTLRLAFPPLVDGDPETLIAARGQA